MRQNLLSVFVLVFLMAWTLDAVEPNSVTTIVHDVDGASNNITSTAYTDGLQRSIQSKQLLSGLRARVVSTFYDAAGRPYLSTKPFVDLAANPAIYFTPGDFNRINAILNNSENYASYIPISGITASAYSKTEFFNDPLGRAKLNGAPGVDYSIESGHFTGSWSFGVTKNASEQEYSFTADIYRGGTKNTINAKAKLLNGFVTALTTTAASWPPVTKGEMLDGFYIFLLNTPITNSEYTLTVVRDPDDRLSQQLSDQFGNTIFSRADNGSEKIVTEYSYDIQGKVLSEIPPKKGDGSTLISSTKYEYNSAGELIRKETPDGTIVRMTYDDAGNMTGKYTYIFNGTTEILKESIKYEYDDKSRLISIGTPYYTGSITLQENYYDNIDAFLESADLYGIPVSAYPTLDSTQGKLVAEVAINRPAGKRFYTGKPSYVVDLYSYYGDGKVKANYKIVPGMPMQTISYTYDIHGKITCEEFNCGTTTSRKVYNYDQYGNLKTIAHGKDASTTDILSYTYNPLGQLASKDFNKLTGGNRLSYTYNIRDWLATTSFSGPNRFSQSLDYIDNSTTPTYNENVRVASILYTKSTGVEKSYVQRYTYDGVDRLVDATVKDIANSPIFEDTYTYDNAGRISSKVEGTANNDVYTYYKDSKGDTDPLKRATSRLKKAKTIGGSLYIYDKKGNLIIDAAKKMYISYDWRNLPIQFSFYNTLPVGETNTAKISPDDYGTITINDPNYTSLDPTQYVDWLCARKDIELQSAVKMYYDAAGKRVLKVVQ